MGNVGIFKGINDATSTIADTAMNLANYQENVRSRRALEDRESKRLALDERRFNADIEGRDRQNKVMDYQLNKLQEQDKIDNAFVPVSSVAPNVLNMPNTRKQYVETLKSAGFAVNETDDDIYIPNKALKFLTGLHQTNQEFNSQSFNNIMSDLQGQNASIGKQIYELQSKGGKEKELAPLLEQQKNLKAQIANIYTATEAYQKEMSKEELKAKTRMDIERLRAERKASGGSSGQGTQIERDYKNYVVFAKQKYPNLRPMTMEEFREDRIKRETSARKNVQPVEDDNDPLGLR